VLVFLPLLSYLQELKQKCMNAIISLAFVIKAISAYTLFAEAASEQAAGLIP